MLLKTYLGTSPDFSEDLVLPLYMVWRITAGRLGSPITLTVWVGWPEVMLVRSVVPSACCSDLAIHTSERLLQVDGEFT